MKKSFVLSLLVIGLAGCATYNRAPYSGARGNYGFTYDLDGSPFVDTSYRPLTTYDLAAPTIITVTNQMMPQVIYKEPVPIGETLYSGATPARTAAVTASPVIREAAGAQQAPQGAAGAGGAAPAVIAPYFGGSGASVFVPGTNNIPTNGIPTNGIPTNGIPTNGIPTNGIPTNNFPTNPVPVPNPQFPTNLPGTNQPGTGTNRVLLNQPATQTIPQPTPTPPALQPQGVQTPGSLPPALQPQGVQQPGTVPPALQPQGAQQPGTVPRGLPTQQPSPQRKPQPAPTPAPAPRTPGTP